MWSTVKNKKRTNYKELKEEYPHIMTPRDVKEVSRKENVDGLMEKFDTPEFIEHQKNGWKYRNIFKVHKTEKLPEGDNYSCLPLANGWGDVILFERI